MTTEREMICRRCVATERGSGPMPFALPGARAVFAPDRVCNVRHIRVEVTLDFATRTVVGVTTQTLAPINGGAVHVVLDAVEMTIESVTLGGTALPHRYDGRKLHVELGERAAGEILDVVIRHRTAPRRGLYFIIPDEHYPDRPTQAWTQGQDEDNRYWFPCFDHPHEKSTSEVIATVPERMTALSNGKLVSTRRGESAGGERTRTFHYRHDVAHSSYLITLVAGEYVEMKESVDGVDVLYYVPAGREEDARRSFARTPEMIRHFAERIGHKYPYDKYAQIVVADFIFGGMENTSATTLTDQTLHDARADLDFSSEPLVAHELAHQWFGDLLTCRDWSHGWLNEGFATYFEIVWKEHSEGRDAADHDRLVDQDAYFEEDGDRYRRPLVTNVFHEPIDVFDRHLYEKGGAVLHMLREELGDDRFWRAVTHYVGKHRGAAVESRDLARAIEEATGVNVDRFFEQWVFGAGYPALEVESSYDEQSKLGRVSIKQTQEVKDGTALFAFSVTVNFVVDGKDFPLRLKVCETQETFLFPLPGKPSQIVLDPGMSLLARWDEKKGQELWAAQVEGARHAIDRVRAARAMGKSGDALGTAPLGRALTGDATWMVRAEAAAALAQLRSDAARDLLAAAVGSEQNPKARRAIVRALGAFRHDAAAAAAARKVLAGDASYFVEAEAAMTLAKTRSEGAFDAALGAMTRPSFLDVIRSACLGAIGELRDERGVELAITEAKRGRPPTSRRAAIALLGLLGDEHPGRKRQALEALVEHLRDPDFRARIAAVEALRVLGDPRALGALGQATASDLDGRVRRRAREVARLIADGQRSKEQVTALRDELEKLRDAEAKLRDRVLKLEAAPKPQP